MENELVYINKILLLENKIISLKKKKQKQPKNITNEPIFYLSNNYNTMDEMSDVSTLSMSENN